MGAKQNIHIVFENTVAQAALLEVVTKTMAQFWGDIAVTMTHNYVTKLVQESRYEPHDLGLQFREPEMLFLYPRERLSGCIFCSREARSLVISISFDPGYDGKMNLNDTAVALWKAVVEFKPIVGMGGEELEVEGDVWLDLVPLAALQRLRDEPLCEIAIFRTVPSAFSELAKPINGDGYIVRLSG